MPRALGESQTTQSQQGAKTQLATPSYRPTISNFQPKESTTAQVGMASGLTPDSQQFQDIKKIKDMKVTPEMSGAQQFALGYAQNQYRNIDKEDNLLNKFVRGASAAAPSVFGTIAGTVGSLAGQQSRATGAGTGAGQAFGESLENLAGIQDETPGQLANEAIAKPLAAGATDWGMNKAMSLGAKVLKPFADAGKKAISSVAEKVVPEQTARNVFRSVFTVPNKVQQRLNLDSMSDTMLKHNITGSLDDLAATSEKVTGQNGVFTRAMRDALGRAKSGIDTNEALGAAQSAADDALNVDDKVLNKTLRKINKIVDSAKTSGIGKSSSIDVWDSVRALEKEGYNLINKSTDLSPNPALEQQGKVFLDAAEALKSQIDNVQVQEGTLDVVKKKFADEVRKVNPSLADEFMGVQTLSELRSLAKPFVDLEQAVNMTKESQNTVFQKAFQNKSQTLGKYIKNPLEVLAIPFEREEFNTGVASALKGNVPGKEAANKAAKTTGNLLKPFIPATASVVGSSVNLPAEDKSNNPSDNP